MRKLTSSIWFWLVVFILIMCAISLWFIQNARYDVINRQRARAINCGVAHFTNDILEYDSAIVEYIVEGSR